MASLDSLAPDRLVPTDLFAAGRHPDFTPVADARPVRGRADLDLGLALRVGAMLGLVLVGYGVVLQDLARSIIGGSRAAYLMVIPVLMGMIAYGRREAPKGVGDDESDWILAGTLGGLALFLSYLTENRFPTLSGLWHIPLLGALVWLACIATILFGARRVTQLWPMWLFGFVTVTPLPAMLLVAAMGGSQAAVAAVAALLGVVAVFLASRRSRLRWRLVVTACCAAVGLGLAVALDALPLAISVAICAGVVPVLTFVALQSIPATRPRSDGAQPAVAAPWPRRSPIGLLLLAGVAALHLMVNTSASATAPLGPVKLASSNWEAHVGLGPVRVFPFISEYLGPTAKFVRYPVPARDGYSAAAVDVITADSLEALRAARHVVWYPAAVIPNYRAVDIGPALPGAVAAASDSSVATDDSAPQWYAVSWQWRAGNTFQQVFVVVNQDAGSADAPPEPTPPSLRNAVVDPILWVARQQADPSAMVDPWVRDRAQQVVDSVLQAAGPILG